MTRHTHHRGAIGLLGLCAVITLGTDARGQCIDAILESPTNATSRNEFGAAVVATDGIDSPGFPVMAVTDPYTSELHLYHQDNGEWDHYFSLDLEPGVGPSLDMSTELGFSCITDHRYTVVVGAPDSDAWVTGAGMAFSVNYGLVGEGACHGPYEPNLFGPDYLIHPDLQAGDEYGASVAAGPRGAVVGAPGVAGSVGAVYAFRYGSIPTYEQTIDGASAPGNPGRFGTLVETDGDWLFVVADGGFGTDRVYIYEYVGSEWQPFAPTPWFDIPPALSSAPYDIELDGDRALISVAGAGLTTVYESIFSGTWSPFTSAAGGGGLALDGDRLVSGTPPGGAVIVGCGFSPSGARLYRLENGVWVPQICLDLSDNQAFLTPVGLAGDLVIVGSPFDSATWNSSTPPCSVIDSRGAVYVYDSACPGILTPDNDLCANAVVLNENVPESIESGCALTDGPASCGIESDVWYTYVPPCSGPIEVIVDGNQTGAAIAVYDGTSCPAATLIACDSGVDGATLTFDAVANDPVLIQVTVDGGSGSIVIGHSLANDLQENASDVVIGDGDSLSFAFSTVDADTDGPSHVDADCTGQFDHDLWYRVTPQGGGLLTIGTCNGTSFDSRIAVYDAPPSPSDPVIAGDLLACADDTAACGTGEILEVAVVAGQSYLVRIGGESGESGCGALTMDFSELPACPNCGGAGGVSKALTSTLFGAPDGSDWEWQIISPINEFAPTPVVHVDGIVPLDPVDDLNNDGLWNEMDLALRFAESITNYSVNVGCDSDPQTYQLTAEVELILGVYYFSVAAKCDLHLYVNGCLVNGGSCTFNPTIEFVPLPGDDCNGNGWDDAIDLFLGTSLDLNENGIPDECECPADLDGDGAVGFEDLIQVLSNWGPCVACPEDIDGSGDVGFGDLILVLSNWGPCS